VPRVPSLDLNKDPLSATSPSSNCLGNQCLSPGEDSVTYPKSPGSPWQIRDPQLVGVLQCHLLLLHFPLQESGSAASRRRDVPGLDVASADGFRQGYRATWE